MSQACKVCLAQHDEEIHAATNRVHRWFRHQVAKNLDDGGDGPAIGNSEHPATPQLNAA